MTRHISSFSSRHGGAPVFPVGRVPGQRFRNGGPLNHLNPRRTVRRPVPSWSVDFSPNISPVSSPPPDRMPGQRFR